MIDCPFLKTLKKPAQKVQAFKTSKRAAQRADIFILA
jgi:hypothetical protein